MWFPTGSPSTSCAYRQYSRDPAAPKEKTGPRDRGHRPERPSLLANGTRGLGERASPATTFEHEHLRASDVAICRRDRSLQHATPPSTGPYGLRVAGCTIGLPRPKCPPCGTGFEASTTYRSNYRHETAYDARAASRGKPDGAEGACAAGGVECIREEAGARPEAAPLRQSR